MLIVEQNKTQGSKVGKDITSTHSLVSAVTYFESLATTRVSARFSSLILAFSAFSFSMCCNTGASGWYLAAHFNLVEGLTPAKFFSYDHTINIDIHVSA